MKVKHHCDTLILQARFVAGGHFVWHCKIFLQSIEKQSNPLRIFDYFDRFLLLLKQRRYFLTLFLVFNKIKRNVNKTKSARYDDPLIHYSILLAHLSPFLDVRATEIG